ncbi:hydroxyacid dehydrogenase [Sporolactobacillus sp. THM7-7]|nr:hydroxyacid dehydrogenase [Sporolactobacillus sp. THM7-7]
MKILLTAPYNQEARQTLAEKIGAELVYQSWKVHQRPYSEDELIALLKDTKAEALITEHDRVTKKVIDSHPLAFIGVCRGTPSNVDVSEASRKGIPVFHTPARNAQAVAELWMANVITFMRHTFQGTEWLKSKQWSKGSHTAYLQFKGNELCGKTVGMVGFGAVGQTIARIIRHFPCNVQFYDPYVTDYDKEYVKKSLEDVFRTSDIVSIHLPVTEQTKGMINQDLMDLMSEETIFVNTSRAVVVDKEALLGVIKEKRIKGAILDVYYHEPPDVWDYKLIESSNVLATPHIAGATHEVEDHHATIMNQALEQWFVEKNDRIRQLANKDVLLKK